MFNRILTYSVVVVEVAVVNVETSVDVVVVVELANDVEVSFEIGSDMPFLSKINKINNIFLNNK